MIELVSKDYEYPMICDSEENRKKLINLGVRFTHKSYKIGKQTFNMLLLLYPDDYTNKEIAPRGYSYISKANDNLNTYDILNMFDKNLITTNLRTDAVRLTNIDNDVKSQLKNYIVNCFYIYIRGIQTSIKEAYDIIDKTSLDDIISKLIKDTTNIRTMSIVINNSSNLLNAQTRKIGDVKIKYPCDDEIVKALKALKVCDKFYNLIDSEKAFCCSANDDNILIRYDHKYFSINKKLASKLGIKFIQDIYYDDLYNSELNVAIMPQLKDSKTSITNIDLCVCPIYTTSHTLGSVIGKSGSRIKRLNDLATKELGKRIRFKAVESE